MANPPLYYRSSFSEVTPLWSHYMNVWVKKNQEAGHLIFYTCDEKIKFHHLVYSTNIFVFVKIYILHLVLNRMLPGVREDARLDRVVCVTDATPRHMIGPEGPTDIFDEFVDAVQLG